MVVTGGVLEAPPGSRVQQLLAELISIEIVPLPFNDPDGAMQARVSDIEREAAELGDMELWQRARLHVMYMRGLLEGDLAEWARTSQEVHQWAADNSRRELLIRSHSSLGTLYLQLGDPAAHLVHAVGAVELLTDDTPAATRVGCLMRFANALSSLGSREEARERYQQAERLAAEIDDKRWLRLILNNYADTEHTAGDPERAWQILEQLMAAVTPPGSAFDLGMLAQYEIGTLAEVQIDLGRYAEAEQSMRFNLRRYEYSGVVDHWAHALDLLTLATAQRHLGETDLAQQTLNQASALCTEHDFAEVVAKILQEQAELYAATGEPTRAFQTHKEFHAAVEKLRSSALEAQARTRQAMFETTEARNQAAAFRDEARRDPLTGLRNRRYVDEHLPRLIEHARTSGNTLVVALADLDHFKRINDTLSHDVGDQVLTTTASILRDELARISGDGFVARMGGEEFLLVLPGTAPADVATHLDDVRRAIRNYDWQPMTGDLSVTVSIGSSTTACIPQPTQPGLLADADRNLYAAKHAGRDRVINNPPPHRGTRRYRDAPKPTS
ncbi:diguanylate cyclase [Krasilnikovia sp. MM14-A1259]|uniref:tetratricopeptide repeat-containing diguanylate cyclase n=1 Tax=Krasilnikovia sp. MM14-A1259 TaxID=3373539 RepID=UPI00399D1A94